MSMSSVSSADLFRIQTKLVMIVRNTLMKINNRALRILNNWTGNMRMIDAAMVTKALLRKENSQCYYGGAVNHISNPRVSMSLVRKQLEAANSTQWQVPWLGFCNSDLDAIVFWKAFKKMDFHNYIILFFCNNISTYK